MKQEKIDELLKIKRRDGITYAASAILPVAVVCLLTVFS